MSSIVFGVGTPDSITPDNTQGNEKRFCINMYIYVLNCFSISYSRYILLSLLVYYQIKNMY